MASNQQRWCGTDEHSDSKNDGIPIRTVCVDGIKPVLTIDETKAFFSRFGEIESIFVRSGAHRYLVQFKHEADAKKALLHTKENWYSFEVKAADPWHQPDHPLQVESPEPDSKSNIVNALNEDCTQEIFKRLNALDLTNVANVCKHFREQAKITFDSKYKHLNVSDQFDCQPDLIKTAMKHFGKEIQSLCINARSFKTDADAIRLIGQCCGPKLKQLQLQLCSFDFQIDLAELRPTFAGLEQLKLHGCSGGGISLDQLMAVCAELKSLALSLFSKNSDKYIKQTFPKLQEFSLDYSPISDEIFKNFVIRHPTMIKLSIEQMQLTSHALRTIGQHAKNLQELNLNQFWYSDYTDDTFQANVAFLGRLHSLKNLQLDSVQYPAAVLNALVAGGVPIECLEIQFRNQTIDDAIKCILRLKQIKNLRLRAVACKRVTDADIIELAKCLPVLEKLHLEEIHGYNHFRSDYEFKSQLSTIGLRKMLLHANKLKLLELRSIDSIKIDVDDYKMMLETVQKREEVVPLVIEFQGNENQIDVPAAVLAKNHNVFNIKSVRSSRI